MTQKIIIIKIGTPILFSTFFLCVSFLIPHVSSAQNKQHQSSRDTTINSVGDTLTSNQPVSLSKDPNFISPYSNGGENKVMLWNVTDDGELIVQFQGRFRLNGQGNIQYLGYDSTGTSYLNVGGVNYAYNVRQNPNDVTKVSSVPNNLLPKRNKAPLTWREQAKLNSQNNKTTEPASDDDDYGDATISKQGNMFILILQDGSKHKVSRMLMKYGDSVAQRKAYDMVPMNTGPWVEMPATGKNIIIYTFNGDEDAGNKGRISIDNTITKQQYATTYVLPK